MRVAIVTPAHAVAPYIGDTIRSVLAQTHPAWRMVVVDDGSTDTTAHIAGRFDDPRIRVVAWRNQGASAARNHGLTLVEGEAVLFLDADDQLAPDALARLTESLAANPWACAAVGAYRCVGGDHAGASPVAPPTGTDLLSTLVTRNLFINGGHILLRRSVISASAHSATI